MKNVNIKATPGISRLIFICCLLFIGKPDMWDLLVYQLSDGQIPIPHLPVK